MYIQHNGLGQDFYNRTLNRVELMGVTSGNTDNSLVVYVNNAQHIDFEYDPTTKVGFTIQWNLVNFEQSTSLVDWFQRIDSTFVTRCWNLNN